MPQPQGKELDDIRARRQQLREKYLRPRGQRPASTVQGIHHLALAARDLPAALERLESQGARLIVREPRTGADSKRIAFLHPSSTAGVLIELVERS